MDINKVVTELITFSFVDWIKDKTLKKYLIILSIIYIIYSGITSVVLYNSFLNFPKVTDPTLIIPQIISLFGTMSLTIIPLLIIITYFKYQIIFKGLNLVKLKGQKITLTKYITMLILPIIVGLAALLSIYDIKKLLIGISGFLLLIIGAFSFIINPGLGAILILIGFLLCLAYGVIIIINSIRFSLSEVTYLITGDISKSFVAGAKMVMAGSLFAGFSESAGDVTEIEEKRYKQYFGSASYNNTRSKKNVEGKCILVQHRGEMKKLLWDIDDGLRSAISYAGGLDMSAFKNVKWGIRKGGVRQ